MQKKKDYEKTIYALAGLYTGRVIAVSTKAGQLVNEIEKSIERLERLERNKSV